MGGLIGTATTTKDGLMSKESYNNCVMRQLPNGYVPNGKSRIWKFQSSRIFDILICADTGSFKMYHLSSSGNNCMVTTNGYNTTFSMKVYTKDYYVYVEIITTANSVYSLYKGVIPSNGKGAICSGEVDSSEISSATPVSITIL